MIAAFRALLVSSASLTSLQIIIALIFVNWIVTLSALFCFSFTYYLVIISTNQLFLKNSVVVSTYAKDVMQYLQESFHSIKDIILSDSQDYQLSNYGPIEYKYRRYGVFSVVLQALPQYIMESLGIIIISTIGVFLFLTQDSPAQSISVLGFFAISFQKLLPCFQSIFRGWSTLKSCNEPINIILRLLESGVPNTNYSSSNIDTEISFSSELSLSCLNFKYNTSDKPVLKDCHLSSVSINLLPLLALQVLENQPLLISLWVSLNPSLANLRLMESDYPYLSFLLKDGGGNSLMYHRE